MNEPKPIFEEPDLLAAACDAYDRMHEMASQYEDGSATDFNERQFVFEIGNVLRERLKKDDPKKKHPWIAYEYHYPRLDKGFRKSECDIVIWERRVRPTRQTTQWIEIKSTGFKYGDWRNDFGGLDATRKVDFNKLESLDTDVWDAQSTASWIWLYQTINYADQFKAIRHRVGRSNGGWSRVVDLGTVAEGLGNSNKRNMNLPKILRHIASAAQSSLMCVRTDLKSAPEGKATTRRPLSVFIVVCSVEPLRRQPRG